MEGVGDYTGFGNPNKQPLQGNESLEDFFARLNLNPTQNPRIIGSSSRRPTMALFYDGFYGNYMNWTRPPLSQNVVPPVSFPDTFVDNSVLYPDIQPSTTTKPLERSDHDRIVDVNSFRFQTPLSTNMVPPPWLYNQQPVFYPPRRRLVEGLRGHVCAVAKDQNGCRILQDKLDEGFVSGEEIEMIFMEVKDHLHELVVHRFANYLIQKLFKASNQGLRTQLLILLVCSPQRFLEVCTDVHGSRTVVKFIDRITTREQKCILLSVLRPIAVTLASNINGYRIIQECLTKFPAKEIRHVIEPFVEHCIYIATNKCGCFVIQECLRYADIEIRSYLLGQIIANALILSEDEFGNYVVQFVLGMKDEYVTSGIIAQLEGSFVTLSFSKYGSNVVEKCLKESGEELSARIIREIMNDPDFVKVIGHDYGNYVAQSALSVSKGDLRTALLSLIRFNYSFLQSNPFGRRVLSLTKSCKNSR
ncbi:hypothetical protein HRI_004019900 [Hibiscus trionum]|uniref:PUM-HD domain-containing protein n=1 Tax=Hibiscus trionum TaxID=183268 RepID=A0A9W7MK38_HIBTR|nr:hypothetical protein HRI_004019900 [Hibiscus trionum]